MKPSEKSKLIEKFWDGNTTLNEEEMLSGDKQQEPFEGKEAAYFSYIGESRKNTFHAQDEIWESIKRHEKRRRALLYWSTGIAASFLVLLSVFFAQSDTFRSESFENQLVSNNVNDIYSTLGINSASHQTLYINGCKSSVDFHTAFQTISPKCIQHISTTKSTNGKGKKDGQNGIVEVWLKGKPDEVFSVCEGTLYFYQDGEMRSVSIEDECSPNLLVDCQELPLSEIAQLLPDEIKSIEFTTDPRNCNGQLDGEFIVLESK
jgi:hypothetical protein